MFEMGNISFMIELLCGQALLLYSCPKRKHFLVRLLLSVAGCILLAYFFPMPSFKNRDHYQIYQLVRFFALLVYTIIGAIICYKIPVQTACSLCVAGYAVQHIAYQTFMLCSRIGGLETLKNITFITTSLLEMIVFAVAYAVCWFCFGRRIAKYEYYKNSDVRFDILSIFIVFVCVVLTRVSYILSGFYSLSPRIYAIVCCTLALVIQFNLYNMLEEKYEREVVSQLWKEERKHYEISKQVVDTINIKCHDLKYKLREHDDKLSKEERRSIEKIVNIYDGMVKTGNEVLDVILAENHLQCQANDIKFSFMGNGEALSFISASDMYSLFGNALDNAREAVMNVQGEKRVINLTVTEKGEFINIDLVNYFQGEIVYVGGEIATSKGIEKEYHGFGIKSMQMLAKKYNGDLRVSVVGDLFSLGIYLLRTDEKE